MPASGALRPVGATSLSCTATDALGRTATCGFSIRSTRTPRLRVSRFLAFSDSMTTGVIVQRAQLFSLIGSPVPYPARLQSLLTARYTAQTIVVVNAGVNGETTADGAWPTPDLLTLADAAVEIHRPLGRALVPFS